ncbi:SUPPRESSOR OF GAMMA RESPONSE 1-like protein [Drosera capensis]
MLEAAAAHDHTATVKREKGSVLVMLLVSSNGEVPNEWPGLPIGVKFDPSDTDLLDHLAAKCGVGDACPHMFIDEFIPTLEEDNGICYTHPKHLPGARKDGSSIHFFHKTSNAYSSGQRKRRKIQTEVSEETIRWHKTGRTKSVIENGHQKGYKKIMVLYRSLKKGSKPVKSNWVMHQYHMGNEKDEKEGEFVVSKIFFQQQKQPEIDGDGIDVKIESQGIISLGPTTPKTYAPDPPRPENSLLCDNNADVDILHAKDLELISKAVHSTSNVRQKEGVKSLPNLAGLVWDSVSHQYTVNSSLCSEMFSSFAPLNDGLEQSINNIMTEQNYDGSYGISDLLNIQLDTPPDVNLADLQFGSQDSILGWLDRSTGSNQCQQVVGIYGLKFTQDEIRT